MSRRVSVFCMRALCLLALATFAGCGTDGFAGGDGGAGDGGPTLGTPPATLGEACDAYGRAACVRALECNQTFTDEDLCVSAFVRRCCGDDDTCPRPLEVDEGRAYSTCTQDTRRADCAPRGETQPLPESCQALAPG